MPSGLSVLVVATQLAARVPGGTGRYVEQLVPALARTVPTGGAVTALLPREWVPDPSRLTVPTTRLRLPGVVLSRLWDRGLPPAVGSARVVHAPTLMVPRVRRGSRLVVTLHDVVPWTHPETLTARGVVFHRRMGERTAREAVVVVTPTEAVADQVRRVLEPAGPVLAVHPGVTVTPAPADAQSRRDRLGLPAAYVLFVGTAEPRKGLDVLVAAMGQPALAGRHLVVAGPPGWGGVQVAALAAGHGVAGRVHVTGRVSEDDLAALYAGAAVVAVPSRAEGFGFPVVEAMAHGTPVVVSGDAALVEVAAGAATVVPVGAADELAEALAEAAEPGPTRTRSIEQGQTRAAQFDWDETGRRMWQVYGSVDTG